MWSFAKETDEIWIGIIGPANVVRIPLEAHEIGYGQKAYSGSYIKGQPGRRISSKRRFEVARR